MINWPLSAGVEAPAATRSTYPTIDPGHRHARLLLDNAMRYLDPKSGTKDISSSYPVEGWNDQPEAGLGLRSFTQLTAIGEWAELLGNIAAGVADTPYMPRKQALNHLQTIAENLLLDQKNPQTGSMGLLGNFLDLAPGKRMGPLAGVVEKRRFIKVFGETRGKAIWQALKEKGWLSFQSGGREASIIRNSSGYGVAFFDGPLAPYGDPATKTEIMSQLDRRTVVSAFGDNANLSTSIATTIGALLSPGVRNKPEVVGIRRKLEQFLDNQQEGYTRLYDPKAGLFYFGWDEHRDRFLGWQDAEGNVLPGYMDYLVNEFRGPTAFIITRFGLPTSAFANLKFKMKPYRMKNDLEHYVLAPWDGSAFQALGLGLSAADGGYRSWQILLKHVAEAEIDYARRNDLPGFLSESYIGDGSRYTGDVGIPEISVNPSPRITHVASLYTIGVAYRVAPAEIEKFLADNWTVISTLLTEHGPWEGYDTSKKQPIRIQTTAHTLSLILGLLGTGPQNMVRYLDSKGLYPRLKDIYRTGESVNLLSEKNNCFAWDSGSSELRSVRRKDTFQVAGTAVTQLGIASVSPEKDGMNLSNGLLTFRFRSSEPLGRAQIQLKPVTDGIGERSSVPVELILNLSETNRNEGEIRVTLPATAGLANVKEAVLVCEPAAQNGPVDLEVTRFDFVPYGS